MFHEEGQGLKEKGTREDWPEVVSNKVCTLMPYICVLKWVCMLEMWKNEYMMSNMYIWWNKAKRGNLVACMNVGKSVETYIMDVAIRNKEN